MRPKLVVGNWKMHGSRQQVTQLLEGLKQGNEGLSKDVAVAVAPSHLHVGLANELLTGSQIALGAQDLHPGEEGAFTGAVSAPMLADYGVSYVIVGHSERRQFFAETDAVVAEKFLAAQEHGLRPILCIGESLMQREQGLSEQIVLSQLDAIVAAAGVQAFRDAVIAYEPIWAIGTGQTATPTEAQQVHWILRDHLAELDAAVASGVQLLYGGSVKSANSGKLFREPDIDGALVGGASLKAEEFLAICKSADF